MGTEQVNIQKNDISGLETSGTNDCEHVMEFAKFASHGGFGV